MSDRDPAVAIDGIRQFLKLHTGCGSTCYDTPDLPGGSGYRAVAACRCGDTVEFWVSGGALSPRQLLEAATSQPLPEFARSLPMSAASRTHKAA